MTGHLTSAWRSTATDGTRRPGATHPTSRPSPAAGTGPPWPPPPSAGLLDFVTFDDALTAQRRRRAEIDPRWLAGRPDAVLIASRVAPATNHIGLIPVATVTHTEPFHVSKAIATLDFVSHGRAGWQVRVSGTQHEAELFGRRDLSAVDLFDEASDAVEVVRRLWDSWEDDAVIRDVATGRFVDRDKLHYIDFERQVLLGQGAVDHPTPTAGPAGGSRARARATPLYEFASRSTDLVFITPQDDDSLRHVDEITQAGGHRCSKSMPTSS